jgi:conjugative relaxase-like TrwC/TraI family protein
VLRITAIGSGAVEYLLRGSGCREHAHEAAAGQQGPGYYTAAVEHGEAVGRWAGSGMEAMGLEFRDGDSVNPDDVRAVFGQLRRPESTEEAPAYLGRRPAKYKTEQERYDALVAKESGEVSPERERELRNQAATDGRRPVAYYDFTFSAPKSVSVYEAALRATGNVEMADAVSAAHDRAVGIAIEYAESRIAFTRTGWHGRSVTGNESIGRHEAGTGTVWTLWRHSTSRENEPQTHTHAALLNRTVTAEGKIGALDGAAFRAFKEAIDAAYVRALEQEVTTASGARFELRPDGVAREIVGVDVELMAEASTRRGQVTELVAERVALYRERHGQEPDSAAMKRITDMAVYETRKAKGPEAGPSAVAGWSEPRTARLAAMVAEVEVAGHRADSAGRAVTTAVAGQDIGPDLTSGVQLREVMAAAVEDVQAQYAVWTFGNLAAALDKRLGDAAALGVSAAERPARLEELTRDALRTVEIVKVSAPDPVEVPEAFRRADGASIYRRANGERYATAAHLATEHRVAARMAAARTPDTAVTDVAALRARLDGAGLSADQAAAVAGIVGSGRVGDCLVGPAGAGKSCTVGELARVWGELTGGRVLGVATSQIATQNLAGDGLEAINSARFLKAFSPDETGQVQDRLQAGDMVMVDEAGMSSTQDLDRIVELAAAAGAKVVMTGDPYQLDAVGAGGLFAHLIAEHGAHELREVHRFQQEWEREASLGLRVGDVAAVDAYADRGRLRTGTVEEMQDAAMESYLADTLAGDDALLIVGSNADAARLSRGIRDQLITMGRVEAQPIARLAGEQAVSVGDRVQARMNDYWARVDQRPGAGGEPDPVTNRALYTVVGRHSESGALLVRDQNGATAHLLPQYVREHVTLAYAVTVHAAQGVTVDASYPVVDRDASREAFYVAMSRGRARNIAHLVTERAPDEHAPERLDESARERAAAILATSGAQRTAIETLRAGLRDSGSFAMAAATLDVAAQDHAHHRYRAVLAEILGPERMEAAEQDRAGYGRLLAATREADLAGHDPAALLAETVGLRGLDTAESVPDVLRWRLRNLTELREPERDVDPADWTTRVPAPDGTEAGRFVAELAAAATDRQARLGRQLAEEPTAWALSGLGEVPDPAEVAAHTDWQRRAGAVAAYRELHRIPDAQESIGAAPSREHPLQRALWADARAALGDQDAVVDHRSLTDGQLYARTERWAREQAAAPEWVADKLADAHRAAHEYRTSHRLLSGEIAAAQAVDHPRHQEVAGMVSERDQAQRMMGWHQQRAAVLEIGYAERAKWAEATRDVAAEELSRRNRDATRAGTVTPGPRTVGAGLQRTRDTGQDTTEQRSAVPASERVGDQQRTAVGEQEQSLAAAMARLREAIGARAAQGRGVEGQEPGQRPTGAAQKQDSTTADPYARLRAWRQERAEAAAYRRGEDSGQETSRQRAAAETARQQRDHGYERPQHQAQEQGQEMDGPSLGY